MPAVSVIVPVYNAGRHLPRCVQSIQSQTMRDLEIVLVDDGSTDGSAQLCEEPMIAFGFSIRKRRGFIRAQFWY